MAHTKDQFSDAELTTFAMEIIKDLCTKPQINSTDAFISELADEIAKELFPNVPSSTSHVLSDMDSSHYYFPSNTSLSTASQYSDLPPIPHATLSPKIVSRCQLSQNDSFNHSLPPLPSSPTASPKRKSRFKFTDNKTRTAAAYSKRKRTDCNPPRFSSPLRPPPPLSPLSLRHLEPGAALRTAVIRSKSFKSDVSPCMSPRHRQAPTKVCPVPNFSEFADIVATHGTKKPKRLPKKPTKIPQKKKDKNKRKAARFGSMYTKNKRDSMRYRSRSTKQIHLAKVNRKRATENEGKTRSNTEEFNAMIRYNHPLSM